MGSRICRIKKPAAAQAKAEARPIPSSIMLTSVRRLKIDLNVVSMSVYPVLPVFFYD